jgi:aldose 1-epimerase
MLAGPCSANRSGPPPRGTGRRVHGARSPSRRRSEATRAPGRTVLRSDERGLPTGTEAVEHTEYDFRKPRQIGSTTFDHASLMWSSEIQITELKVSLWVDQSYPYVMLFSGDPLPNVNRRSLAVEPMTCPPNAFRTKDALIRLEPGSSFIGTWGIAHANARIGAK